MSEPSDCAVLVVDDVEDLRESFKYVLELEGYRVVCAENGQRALEALEGLSRPTVILLDLMMPVMNGFEFLEAMRAGAHRDLPVCVVSAFADRASGLDVQAVLEKPVRVATLCETVARLAHGGDV